MRTTIQIDDHLMTRVKEFAAKSGKTMTTVIEDALRQSFERKRTKSSKHHIRLTTVAGKAPGRG
jgi:predicted transcriptional regulator